MKPTVSASTIVVSGGQRQDRTDALAVEEPLEIRVAGHSIAVTMRTPGHDFELAAGFLLTEGVVRRPADIREVRHCPGSNANVVQVELNSSAKFDPNKLSRHVFTTSSCGVCGKTTLEQVRAVLPASIQRTAIPMAEVLCGLPEKLRAEQTIFSSTGGLHATALFDASGKLRLLREDVGRHNAMDKLLGELLLADKLPATETVVLVSGRASFELVQKAAMAGIPTLAAVGAPSSLAVELARELGMNLVGFLRGDRFNIYCGEGREGKWESE
jgi:FdhD protein